MFYSGGGEGGGDQKTIFNNIKGLKIFPPVEVTYNKKKGLIEWNPRPLPIVYKSALQSKPDNIGFHSGLSKL